MADNSPIFGSLAPIQRINQGFTKWWEDLPESTNVEDRRTALDKKFDEPPAYYLPSDFQNTGKIPLGPMGVEDLQNRFRQVGLLHQKMDAPMAQRILTAFINGMLGGTPGNRNP